MQSPLLGVIRVSPFALGATPSRAMIGYGAVYAIISLLLAMRLFGKRDL
jgi:hypothetical protein